MSAGSPRQQDLKVCDRLLTRNTLTWRTAGAVEGGAMGLLALVPVAGIPVALLRPKAPRMVRDF